MAEVIFMTGARGGAGVTTCAFYLAEALSAEGERTLFIDGDSDSADGLELCGLQGLSVYTLADVEDGACRVKQAILQHGASPNLYVLPTLGCKSQATVTRAIEECGPLFDYIICDNAGADACPRAVLVCDPYTPSLNRAKKRSGELKDGGFKQIGLIVNKVNGGLVFDGFILTPQEIADVVRLPLLGVIPEDLTLPLGKIKPSTRRAFALTGGTVAGKSRKIYGVIKPYAGMGGILKRRLRSKI